MVSIIKKKRKGNSYYYAAESARVNGKPRIVWQKYLGTVDDIIKMKAGYLGNISEVDIFNAGGVAAMLRMAQKLSLVEIIDEIIPKRNQGASVGQYILLAALNRILAPCSKLQISDWYQKTILYRIWKLPPEIFTSQMFWNHMDLISDDHIEQIQKALATRLLQDFKIQSDTLLYDTTNFFTYIASGNTRNAIAKRGKSKAKRNDLRQVGLALLVSKDFQIPIFHKVYDGSQPDRGIFPQVASELTQWQNNQFEDSTLVFDKGNISEEALTRLMLANRHYVCAVPKTTDLELYSTGLEQMKYVPGLPGTRAYSATVEIWNKTHKAIICYSDSFFASEMADLMDKLRKCEGALNELDLWLLRGPMRPQDEKYFSKASIQKHVNEIINKPRVKEAVDVRIKKIDGRWKLEYGINQEKIDDMMKTSLGRTLILSTRLNWNEQEIISSYRGQHSIESAFKYMKHRTYLHWQPEFHWTDHKIKIHGLYCVLALLLASLCHRAVVQSGMDINLISMLEELNEIREVALIYHGQEKTKKNHLALSKLNSNQKRLSKILDIPAALIA